MAALLAAGVQVRAQEGPLVTLGVSLDARHEANEPDEDESVFQTGLSFALRHATRSQSFLLSSESRIVFDNDGADFETPRAALEYGYETRSTAFDIGLSYSVQDVSGTTELIDPITGGIRDLVNDDGTLETVRYNAELETGRDARFGTTTRLSFTERTYAGTSDPDLTDLRSWEIGTTLRFDVSPVIQLSADASYRETEEEDAVNTLSRTTRFGLDGSFRVDPLWTVTAGIDIAREESEIDAFGGGRVLDTEESHGFSLAARRQFRDGSLGASYVRNVDDAGAQETLSLFGDRSLTTGGDLAWSIGVVSFPGGDTTPIYSVSYSLPTPRGGLSIDFGQSTTSDDDDETIVNTTLGLDWAQQINAVSSWSLNGSFRNVDATSDTGQDQAQARVGLSYTHAVTEDWALSTELSHRVTYVDGVEDDRASVLSLSLQRSFSFRP